MDYAEYFMLSEEEQLSLLKKLDEELKIESRRIALDKCRTFNPNRVLEDKWDCKYEL